MKKNAPKLSRLGDEHTEALYRTQKSIESYLMTTKKLTKKKTPPQQVKKSVQMDLFGRFVANDGAEVSNTVELWDSIPKYFFTPHQMKKLRTVEGLAKPFEWKFRHVDTDCMVVIQPALIKQKDGSYLACFPSVTEELVEEALKKILCDQQYGMHDVEKSETWVRFTLGMVRKELVARKRMRSVVEIKHALEVMSKCILTYYQSGKEVWNGAILQDLVTVGRDEYLADREAQHVARLPLFVTRSINRLEYRQFNIDRLMCCDEQLTRWIYRRLINRYKQASYMNNYHFMFSDMKESGLLQQSAERDNRKKVISCLQEAIDEKVISRYDTDERREGRKIVDVKYTVHPTREFIAEQKASNKRATDHLATAKRARISVVDK